MAAVGSALSSIAMEDVLEEVEGVWLSVSTVFEEALGVIGVHPRSDKLGDGELVVEQEESVTALVETEVPVFVPVLATVLLLFCPSSAFLMVVGVMVVIG